MASPSVSNDPSTDPSTDIEIGELQHFQLKKPSPSRGRTAALLDAAAFLSLWSLLVINEGAVRLVDASPAADLTIGGPSIGVRFTGGLFQVIVGLAGLFVGVAAFVRKVQSPAITMAAMALQAVLGAYVFVVYVFLIPAFRASNLTEPIMSGLSLGQSRFLITLGILTSFHFCLALQGGQFMFAARLLSVGTGRDVLRQRPCTRMHAVLWNANMAAAGLWTFATGMFVRINVGGSLNEPFRSPPNVGMLPGMTTWTGIIMMFWAAVGIIITLSRSPVPGFYFPVTAYVFLECLLNYTIVQFGLIEDADGGAVARHVGLVFVVVFLGPYFVQVAAREREEGSFL